MNDAAEGQGRLYPGGGERGVLKGRGASGNDCITRAERRGKKKMMGRGGGGGKLAPGHMIDQHCGAGCRNLILAACPRRVQCV